MEGCKEKERKILRRACLLLDVKKAAMHIGL